MRRLLVLSALVATPCVGSACKRSDDAGAQPSPATSAPAHTAAAIPAAPPATERLVRVKSAAAPLLPEIEDDENASQVPHAGDLLYVAKDLPPLRWKGTMDGVTATREGPMVVLKRAEGDAQLFGFKSDLGEEVEVPSSASICARLGAALPDLAATARASCAALLRRVKTSDGAIVAYQNCSSGPCPVGLLRGDKLGAMTVDGVVDTRLATVAGRDVLITSTRWVRDEGKWTGGVIVTLTLDRDKPIVAATIPTDEVDARPPVMVIQRNVKVVIGEADVRITGDHRTVDRNSGKERDKKPIDERHPLLGK